MSHKETRSVTIASGSARKAELFKSLTAKEYRSVITGEVLKDIDALHDDLTTIPNGDVRMFGERTLISQSPGLDTYFQPSDGETSGNNPLEQAVNKVVALALEHCQVGLTSGLIMATDTVEFVSTADHPLGKPRNGFEYRGYEHFVSEIKRRSGAFKELNEDQEVTLIATNQPAMQEEGVSEKHDEKGAQPYQFDREQQEAYLLRYYPPGTEIINTNGVAGLNMEHFSELVLEIEQLLQRALSREELTVVAQQSTKVLKTTITSVVDFAKFELLLETIPLRDDCGGGGVSQCVIDFIDENSLRLRLDGFGAELLQEIEGVDLVALHVYGQIAGCPFLVMQYMIDHLDDLPQYQPNFD